ncbi:MULTISPECIES: alpha/beta hydrolase [Thermomonosporaceae]|uniref:alpha/beta hydrolase n=1 Tax=Thermomonosporaceae TaxID=2012 RepID=UPI00255ABD2F|nr:MULTISPECIES: alpha/beta hydrolase-fold protein [Thermomonosporaceae]MDL4772829.1 alpha/beta hydrolase-fold protein [Actinomadura xylanilytica]
MSLTGRPLLCLLIVVVIALVTATVWGWRRLAGSGAGFIAGRLGLIAVCQVLITLSVLVVINRNFGFYESWGELAGAGGAGDGGRLTQRQGQGGVGVNAKLIKRKPEMSIGGVPQKDGRLDTVDIRGARSGLHARAYVYLPPQYFQPGGEKRRFPVAVALSGYPGALRNLVTQVKVPQTARDEIRAGRVQPTVYVLLRPSMVPGRDTECMDVPGGPQTSTFFTQDLPEAVRANYRVPDARKSWGVFGLSTGGYCSLKLAMRNSDVFSAAASLSGYYGAIKDVTTGDLYGGSQTVRNENDLFWRLGHMPPPPVSVLVTTSKVGEKNKEGTERFLSLVKPPMRASSITLDSGGHNFQTWNRVLPQVLRWMSRGLSV